MPATTSPWTVIITAAAAFFGVILAQVVAQWWTTRREDRNFQKQLQMYSQQWEDQRHRDAEQREDQRRRDHEIWHREDLHRFTTEKRAFYAQFTEAMGEYINALIMLSNAFQSELEHRTREGSGRLPDVQRWINGQDFSTSLDEKRQAFFTAYSTIRLVASRSVDDLAWSFYSRLRDSETILVKTQDVSKVDEHIVYVANNGRAMLAAMRFDLGVPEEEE